MTGILAAATLVLALPNTAGATEYLQSGDSIGVVEGDTVVYPSGDGVDEPFLVATASLRRPGLRRFSLACGRGSDGRQAGIAPAGLGVAIEDNGRRIWLLGTVLGRGRPGSLCDQALNARPSGPHEVVLVSNDAGRSFALVPPPPAIAPKVERAPVLLGAPAGRGVLFGSPVAGWFQYAAGASSWSSRTLAGATFGLHREPPRTNWEIGPPYNARHKRFYEPALSRRLDDSPTPRIWTQWGDVERSTFSSIFTIRQNQRTLRTTRARLRIRARRVLAAEPSPCPEPRTGLSRGIAQAVSTIDGRIVWGLTSPAAYYRCRGKRGLYQIEARSRLVKSADYGRSWRPIKGPPGTLNAVTAVDGRTPIVATNACRSEYQLRQYRRVGTRWRQLGCRPGS